MAVHRFQSFGATKISPTLKSSQISKTNAGWWPLRPKGFNAPQTLTDSGGYRESAQIQSICIHDNTMEAAADISMQPAFNFMQP